MAKTEVRYPPYTGDWPYLFLCFAEADEQRVLPLLRRLWVRGCRVWYSIGRTADLKTLRERSERREGAALTVVYGTDALRTDTDAKSAALSCQARGCPIIAIDVDAGSELSLGLTQAVHISRPKNDAEAESALLRAEGFSQALIGEPREDVGTPTLRTAAIVLAVLAVLAVAAGVFIVKNRKPPESAEEAPTPTDTVLFTDAALTEAVREAIGGGLLTPESVESITTLRLSDLPADADELKALPNLVRLELPQSAIREGGTLNVLLERYELVLIGGGA